MRKILPLSIILILLFSSCKVFFPSQMLRTGKDFKYSEFPTDTVIQPYRMAANDQFAIRLSTNAGERQIDPIVLSSNQGNNSDIKYYNIDIDGMVKLPILGRIKMSGLTLLEAEKLLEDSYSKYFNDPFVQINVINNRVTIFPGGEGSLAKVVPLQYANTSLLEGIALAGGINDGRAHKIKLIRGDLKNPQV